MIKQRVRVFRTRLRVKGILKKKVKMNLKVILGIVL